MNVNLYLNAVLEGLYHAFLNSKASKESRSDKLISEQSKRAQSKLSKLKSAKLKRNRLISEHLQSDDSHHGQVKRSHRLVDEKTKHIRNNFREHQMRF